MRLEDLFPPCMDERCDGYGKHKHVLPHQRTFLDSRSKFIYWQSGFGSGKTLTACIRVFGLLMKVPGNRAFIGRRTLPKLHDTTQRIFMEVLERAQLDGIEYKENRDGWSHHITFPNGSELFFRPTQDLGRFLGPEYGCILIDEAQEEPESTFRDLTSRLRLPLAKRYLNFILLSNPPGRKHWLFKHFGDKPGVVVKEAEVAGRKLLSTYEFIKSSTRENPNVGDQYIADLILVHGEEAAKRVIDGEYSFSHTGIPVYMPPFSYAKHVGEPIVVPRLGVLVSWDFGRRHPAVTFHQVFRCKHHKIHWTIVGELVDATEIETPQLATLVKDYMATAFPHTHPSLFLHCGDRSGINKTDRGAGPITVLAQAPHYMKVRYKVCDIQSGIDFIADLLRKPNCSCGMPVVLVHHKCQGVVEAFGGGYHYAETRPNAAPKDKPVKDGYFDDIMDSVRYAAEHFVRPAMLEGRLPSTIEVSQPTTTPSSSHGWEWMIA